MHEEIKLKGEQVLIVSHDVLAHQGWTHQRTLGFHFLRTPSGLR